MLDRTVHHSGDLQAVVRKAAQAAEAGVILLDNEQFSLVLESSSLDS